MCVRELIKLKIVAEAESLYVKIIQYFRIFGIAMPVPSDMQDPEIPQFCQPPARHVPDLETVALLAASFIIFGVATITFSSNFAQRYKEVFNKQNLSEKNFF